MLKIWGRKNSINVQKVMWAVAELGLPHTRIDAGGQFGSLRDVEYLARNPNALIPTIDDGGFILWESNAIVRYFADKHGAGTLWPADLRVRADADRWMDWQATTVQPPMRPVFMGLIRTPPEKRDMAAIEASRIEAEGVWRIFDAYMKGRTFVTGTSLTMGDIPVGCYLHRWYGLPIERPKLANLEAYYARLGERPAFRTHVMMPLT
ncbi:MAG: glutathione S-transferase [Rhodospirillales bacterium]|nr:glutathione S-transferase [Rhodospirillales bacterium]